MELVEVVFDCCECWSRLLAVEFQRVTDETRGELRDQVVVVHLRVISP